VARRCVVPDAGADAGLDAGTRDAGQLDGGDVDGGEVDGGVDAGEGDAGALDAGADGGSAREDCTNGVDDDGDDEIDCVDRDCRMRVCRPAAGPCDVEERCSPTDQCPIDQQAAVDTACDDGDPCTADTRCQSDAGCSAGKSGELIGQCEVPGGIHNMVRGTTCFVCAFTMWSPLFREVPDAGPLSVVIYSQPVMDGGSACDVCADWHIAASATGAECSSNTVTFAVSGTPRPGLVPVFQFRSTSGPGVSAFGLDAGAPPAGFGAGAPVFWACPP
jgi:hypothetical protein